ncbi:TadE/TadG family type IV pilus assembly protein [Marinobacter sp.]|uniref:TadE/TadG family type IV pilus assembly protein n=1 Tax=Marinobacter sp. TaxID=50741 RepID=UPI0019FD5F64|nr:TadE/TadG family type IV pilus assembly protein [Marinobacter sp.]MBE0487154.1 pilus assembly protein [Marinobacter sp.]
MSIKNNRGVIALEFLMVFPMIMAIIYGAAGYGVLFYNKYQMQVAVDRAASAVFSLDRREYATFSDGAVTHSSEVLAALSARLPAVTADHLSIRECKRVDHGGAGGVQLLECVLVADPGDSSFMPQVRFPGVGAFPPMPSQLTARSSIAF